MASMEWVMARYLKIAIYSCSSLENIAFVCTYPGYPWMIWVFQSYGCTQTLLRTQKFLHSETFTHKRFYTQQLLRTDAFTHTLALLLSRPRSATTPKAHIKYQMSLCTKWLWPAGLPQAIKKSSDFFQKCLNYFRFFSEKKMGKKFWELSEMCPKCQ